MNNLFLTSNMKINLSSFSRNNQNIFYLEDMQNIHFIYERFLRENIKNFNTQEVKDIQNLLLLSDTITNTIKLFSFLLKDEPSLDLAFNYNISLIKNISNSLNIPYQIIFFNIAEKIIQFNQNEKFLFKLEEEGLDLNSAFLRHNTNRNKLIHSAFFYGNLKFIKILFKKENIDYEPGIISSFNIDQNHPFNHNLRHINNSLNFRYSIKEIAAIENLNKDKYDEHYEEEKNSLILFILNNFSFEEDAKYLFFEKENLEHILFLMLFSNNNYLDKKDLKKIFNFFNEQDIHISEVLKDKINYLLISTKLSYNLKDIPWSINSKNNLFFKALIDNDVPKYQDNVFLSKYYEFDDNFYIKYSNSFYKLLQEDNNRVSLENNLIESVAAINYKESGSLVQTFTNFLNFPLYKILIDSNINLSEDFFNKLKTKIVSFKQKSPILEESLILLANNIESLFSKKDQNNYKKRI